MKKVFVVLFVLYSVNLVCAQENLSPFLVDMKERYELNTDFRTLIVLAAVSNCNGYREFELKCTDADKAMLKKLYCSNDPFALDVYAQLDTINVEERIRLQKKAGELGAPFSISRYVNDMKLDDAENYIKKVIGKSVDEHYLVYFYLKNNMSDKVCEAIRDGYRKRGIEFLSGSFVDRDSERSRLTFSKCNLFDETDPYKIISSMHGEEYKLIEAFMLVRDKKWSDAKAIFEQLRKSNDSRIAINSQTCIGMMTLYGYGYDKNVDSGIAILKESYDEGLFNLYGKLFESNKVIMPKNKEIVSYSANDCLQIK